jgi:hypothetical protein
MTTRFTTENLKSVFTFPFQDESWVSKLIVGTLLYIAGVVIFPYLFVLGYLYEIMRRVILEAEEPSLPAWEHWGRLLADGLKLFGASLVYNLPGLVLLLASQLAAVVFIPLSESASSPESAFPLLGMSVMMVFMGLGILLGMLGLFATTVAAGHMVATGEFTAAFRVGEWWPVLRKNLAGYLIAFVILGGASWIANFISQLFIFTIVLCVVYPVFLFFAYTYISVVGAAMFAQAYVEGLGG